MPHATPIHHHTVADPGEALAAALDADDMDRVALIVDRWGVDLAHSVHAPLVHRAALCVPLEIAASYPGLGYRLEDLGRLPIGTTPIALPSTREEAETEFARHGDLKLRQALLPMATRRRLGRFDDATAIVHAGGPLAEASVYPWYSETSRILPYWYLQAGITAHLAGSLDSARRYLLSAWTHRGRDPYGFVARSTAGRLAILEASSGDHTASRLWAERSQAQDRRPDLWVDGFNDSNLAAAAAIGALDGLDPQVDALLTSSLHPSQRNEQWSVFLWIHVRHALTWGDSARALRYLEDTLSAHRAETARGGLAAGVVPFVKAQILLATGQPNLALRALAGAPDVDGLGAVLRARILLLADQPAEAAVDAEAVVRSRASTAGARTEALLLAAVAHLSAGDRPAAVSAAARALARIETQNVPRVLATVPRTALDDLALDLPALAPHLAVLDERGITDIYPATVTFVTVTEREHDLLRQLGSRRTLAEIAADHFVSVNTVRTHLANLRKKLDARSRDEVLVKARRLGLLDEEGEKAPGAPRQR